MSNAYVTLYQIYKKQQVKANLSKTPAAAATLSLGTAILQVRQFGAAMVEASALIQGTKAEMTLSEACSPCTQG